MIFRRRDRPPFPQRLREFVLPRAGWRRALEYIGLRLRRIPDTPHRIALGFACGAFASFSPFFGVHLFYAAGLAWALRANLLASLIGTAVGNPLTFPLIASVSMALGRRILGDGVSGRDFNRLLEAFRQAMAVLWEAVRAPFGGPAPEWSRLTAFFDDILLPWSVGGLLPGLVVAIASYYTIRSLVAAFQAARRARLKAGRASAAPSR